MKKVGFKFFGVVDLEESSPHRSKTTAWGSWMSPSAPYIYNPKKKNSPTNIYNQSPNYNLRRSKILLPNDSPDQKDSIGKLSDYTADSIISSPNRTDTIYQTLKNENDSLKLDVKSMKNALCLCKLDLQNLSNETENLRVSLILKIVEN